MEKSVLSLKEKTTTQHWCSNIQVLTTLMTDPLNIIFREYDICLLGYTIEFSCLYIPQGQYFISIVCLWSTDEYVFFYFERKSTFNKSLSFSAVYTQNNDYISVNFTCMCQLIECYIICIIQ